MWIHEHHNWPNFPWDAETPAPKLADIRHRQGRLLGRMEGLGFELRSLSSQIEAERKAYYNRLETQQRATPISRTGSHGFGMAWAEPSAMLKRRSAMFC